MHSSIRLGALRLCTVIAAAFAATPAFAASLEVAPTKLVVDGQTGAATLSLANRGTVPIIVQLEGFKWDQVDGKDVLKPADAILVSPPMTRIAPGSKQIVRIMVRPDGQPGNERTYRLFASELPDPSNNETHAIRVLLQFNVPMFVNTPTVAAPQIKWDASVGEKGLALSAQNLGRAHSKFTKIEVVTQSGARVPATSRGIPYLLAGAARTFQVAGSFTPGEKVTVEARTEESEAAIRETLDVHR